MNNKNKKVLVTGAAGYIGSVLVRQLLNRGYNVRGADILFFGDESLREIYNHPQFEFIQGNICENDFVTHILDGISDVIHLAAIVGDPACSKQPELAEEINWKASKNLYDECIERNLFHFIFASTCSNYGKMHNSGFVNEDSPLNPISLYAQLKVRFEKYILDSHIPDNFSPAILRFATVYGVSPRMRFDLTINEFIRDVVFKNTVEIFGEQFWRPYCHVEDLARSCVLTMESPSEKIRKNIFNVGDTSENYQKKMIAEEILKIIPDAIINYVHRDEDPRDYRVDFSKIQKLLGYRISKKVPNGLEEIYTLLKAGLITDPYSPKYKNI